MQQELLEFERRWPRHNADKTHAVSEYFATTMADYERMLKAVLELPAAKAYDADLVSTIARQRRGLKWFLDRPEYDWR